jgi:hypothetical protein
MIRSALPPLARQFGEDLVGHAQPAPADEPVTDRLVRAILPWFVTPPKNIPNHKHDGAHNPPVIHPRDAVRQRKNPSIRRICSSESKNKSAMAKPHRLPYESVYSTQCKKFNRS